MTQKEISIKASERRQSIIDCWNRGIIIAKDIAKITHVNKDEISRVLSEYIKSRETPSKYVQTEEEMMQEIAITDKCTQCGYITSESIGAKSNSTGLCLCIKCKSELTIGDAIRIGGHRLDEFLKEVC